MISLRPPEELGKLLTAVASEWPCGATVWHRADGRRGIVEEYAVDGQGCVMIVVTWGANQNWDKCSVGSLSSTKVTDDDNGDGWLKQSES